MDSGQPTSIPSNSGVHQGNGVGPAVLHARGERLAKVNTLFEPHGVEAVAGMDDMRMALTLVEFNAAGVQTFPFSMRELLETGW